MEREDEVNIKRIENLYLERLFYGYDEYDNKEDYENDEIVDDIIPIDDQLEDDFDFLNLREDDDPLEDEVEDDYYINKSSAISEEINNIEECKVNVTLDYIVENRYKPSLGVSLNPLNYEGFCKKIFKLKYEFYERIKEATESINILKTEYNKRISSIANTKIKELEKKMEYLSQFIDDFDIALTIDKLKKLVINDSTEKEEKKIKLEKKMKEIFINYSNKVEIQENLIYSVYFKPYMNNAQAKLDIFLSKKI